VVVTTRVPDGWRSYLMVQDILHFVSIKGRMFEEKLAIGAQA